MAVLDIAIEPDEDEEPDKPVDRAQDLLGRKGSKLRAKLTELHTQIGKGFRDQSDRSDDQMDYWDCFNCELNNNQSYNGNSQIYVPIVHDAIEAITTRYVNQLFPPSRRYVEVTTTDGSQPDEIVALLDYYIDCNEMKTAIAQPLIRHGYIEGQYNLYVYWWKIEREIVTRQKRGVDLGKDLGGVLPKGEQIEDIEPENIVEAAPGVEVLHDSDVLVLPPTFHSVERALADGGVAVIVRRCSKAKIEAMIDEGSIRESEGEELIEMMKEAGGDNSGWKDVDKALNEHVGIRAKGGYAIIWEVWKLLPLSGRGVYSEKGTPRLCQMYLGPNELILGCHRNPYWNDRCPLRSDPVKKIAGQGKGDSMVATIASLQYEANDAVNEGADAATYSAMPIIQRDPEKGGAPLVYNLAAVWNDPSAKLIAFPDLTPRAVTRIEYCTRAIFNTLGVNPSMLPQQQTGGGKNNQARVAQEQQVDLLTTAVGVSTLEDELTWVMGWFVDLDTQYREDDITVRAFGNMGRLAKMESVPPLQNRTRYQFRWAAIEQSRNAQMLQQQIAWINVARGMEQALKAEGKQLKVSPVLEASAMGVFGARLAPLVFVDMRHELTVPPDEENALLAEGHDLFPHPMDNFPQHMKAHMQEMQLSGDPSGMIQVHIGRHVMMQQAVMAAQAAQQQPQGAPGVPGGTGPGVAGTPRSGAAPRIGAQPAGPRMMKQAPGAVHPDQMPRAGAVPMPRRMG